MAMLVGQSPFAFSEGWRSHGEGTQAHGMQPSGRASCTMQPRGQASMLQRALGSRGAVAGGASGHGSTVIGGRTQPSASLALLRVLVSTTVLVAMGCAVAPARGLALRANAFTWRYGCWRAL
mmetsp:Transcript_25484/g.80403  ORF Transcript_25484/g.80403 Transcript_25484/m.80403 type:complete len:122 (+) Transcript_25484:80-445(+)